MKDDRPKEDKYLIVNADYVPDDDNQGKTLEELLVALASQLGYELVKKL